MVLHGAGGGYDQGLLLARQPGEQFRIISPSRFGYLNAPIPHDRSVAAQAKAYASLLNAMLPMSWRMHGMNPDATERVAHQPPRRAA
ncbi:MAG TPA: hypothetical protein VFO07_01490 [Roseiflexaceae bacterium]|nr:hypothetical protein [Roseiflexaceae bacterium]